MTRQMFQHHPTVGYHFVPSLKARVEHEGGGYLVRTNAAGFRCQHEFAKERVPGLRRILLFGDSYTAGDGVSNKARYGDVLESLVPDCEVYNFGLSGSGTDQQYLIWREFARDIECDLVVIGVLVENIRRITARYRPYQDGEGQNLVLAKPYFVLNEDGLLELEQVPVPKDPVDIERLDPDQVASVDMGGGLPWLRKLVNRMGPRVKDLAQRLSHYQPLPDYDRADNSTWKLMEAILRSWTGEIEAPIVICPIPLYQFVEKTASPAGYQARFASLDDPPRVTVHDPLPDMLRYDASERRAFRFENDCHLTPSAHRVVAESLASTVALLLPVGQP